TAVLSMIYGLKRLAQDGVTPIVIAAIIVGAALGIVFARRQLRLADPLLDLRLFKIRAFTASLTLYGVTILVLFGGFFLLPQYLQLVHGLSPLRAGLWTLPWSLAFIVGSAMTPPLSRRMRPALLMSGGLLLSALGFILLAGLTPTTGFVMFATATFIFTLGSSPVFTLTNDVIIGSAPPERAGAASGISETCAELGGALGIAVFGSIGIVAYRSVLAMDLPSGIP